MRPQLVIDYGDAALSALLVTAEGEHVPWSQEIQQIATRHVSPAILFEPRVIEHSDFVWDDALETLSKSSARTFFQRARRLGMRRPWDPQAPANALQLATPLSVLSSPAALADRQAAAELPRAGLTLLDALLEPIFAFVTERQTAMADVDAAIVISSRTGHRARLVLQKLFRQRGVRRLAIVPREIAAALSLVPQAPCACVVVETSDDDLYLHRVALEVDAERPQVSTTASITVPGLGWKQWSARIAEAVHEAPSAAFERSLLAVLVGSPDSLPLRITHSTLQSALGGDWIEAHSLAERIGGLLTALGGENLPLLFAGEIFTLAPVRALAGPRGIRTPLLDDAVQNVARALRSGFRITTAGSLRLATLRGPSSELLSPAQLPAAGQSSHADADFRASGGGATRQPFLIHLLLGEATLCAMPLELGDSDDVRLTLHLHRSRTGSRLYGTIEARTAGGVVAGRSRFTAELEVAR